MGQSFYLACKDCREMVHLGKLTETFYPNDEELREFMQEHVLHRLVVTGDAFQYDSDIIKFKEDSSLWDTDYKIFTVEGK